jgi:hypothetical protein
MARVKIEVPINEVPQNKQQTVVNAVDHTSRGTAADTRTVSVKMILTLIGAVLFVIFVFNLQAERSRLQKELNGKTTSQTNDQVLARISQTVELPRDETPQTRTIEDASKFKEGSDVLKEIQDGDIWIFYPKAGKQVFYRPSTMKVIFVVPLAPETATPKSSS